MKQNAAWGRSSSAKCGPSQQRLRVLPDARKHMRLFFTNNSVVFSKCAFCYYKHTSLQLTFSTDITTQIYKLSSHSDPKILQIETAPIEYRPNYGGQHIPLSIRISKSFLARHKIWENNSAVHRLAPLLRIQRSQFEISVLTPHILRFLVISRSFSHLKNMRGEGLNQQRLLRSVSCVHQQVRL